MMRSTTSWARRCAPVLSLLAALAVGARDASAQGAYKVIVNPNSAATSVSKSELAAVFLKKATRWSDGTPAAPVDQSSEADVRSEFSREILGRPTTAIRAYWNQMAFSGRNVPPSEKTSDADVVAFVRSTPGAVGYVRASTPTPGVKVVSIRS